MQSLGFLSSGLSERICWEEDFMHKLLAFALVLGSVPLSASAQFSRVVTDKRNIEILPSEKVTVPQENTKASAKIIQALLDAKIPKDAIETQTISLERQDEMNGPNATRTTKFSGSRMANSCQSFRCTKGGGYCCRCRCQSG